jgi:hypothetical protein
MAYRANKDLQQNLGENGVRHAMSLACISTRVESNGVRGLIFPAGIATSLGAPYPAQHKCRRSSMQRTAIYHERSRKDMHGESSGWNRDRRRNQGGGQGRSGSAGAARNKAWAGGGAGGACSSLGDLRAQQGEDLRGAWAFQRADYTAGDGDYRRDDGPDPRVE